MTRLLRALRAEPAGVAFVDRASMVASDEAVRLAFRLRDCPVSHGGRLVLFVPASRGLAAEGVVTDAVCGLLQLNERPVLVVDLRPSEAALAEPHAPMFPLDQAHDADFEDLVVESAGAPVVVTHPFAPHRDPVRYAASAEFASLMARARASYSYVLLVGGPVTSVETLITAGLCDGVVLAIRPEGTTRGDIQRVTDELRRARAHVLGFVVDARGRDHKGEPSWRKR
jgi:hypothetical protein